MSDPCYTEDMNKAPETIKLDEDVQRDLGELAERSGYSVDALANAVLRQYARYESEFIRSVERGIADAEAGRFRTTAEVRALLEEHRRARQR